MAMRWASGGQKLVVWRTFRSHIKYVGSNQGEQKLGICKTPESCIEH